MLAHGREPDVGPDAILRSGHLPERVVALAATGAGDSRLGEPGDERRHGRRRLAVRRRDRLADQARLGVASLGPVGEGAEDGAALLVAQKLNFGGFGFGQGCRYHIT